MGSCVFCRIASREAPAYLVYQDDDLSIILDIYPVEKGHLLVISNNHYESIHDTSPSIVSKAFRAAAALARIYREYLNAPGVNVFTNSGRAAGQEVFHFHIHVIPRWRGGGWRTLTVRHRLTMEEAREVLEMLKPYTYLIEEYLNSKD